MQCKYNITAIVVISNQTTRLDSPNTSVSSTSAISVVEQWLQLLSIVDKIYTESRSRASWQSVSADVGLGPGQVGQEKSEISSHGALQWPDRGTQVMFTGRRANWAGSTSRPPGTSTGSSGSSPLSPRPRTWPPSPPHLHTQIIKKLNTDTEFKKPISPKRQNLPQKPCKRGEILSKQSIS